MSKGQSLQDPFLNALRKDRIPVSIFLVNGIKLQGQIESFDQYVVLLKNTVSQMVYKHAISTVVPTRNPRTDGVNAPVGTGYPAPAMNAGSTYQGGSTYPNTTTGQGFERGFTGTTRTLGGFTRTPSNGFERQGNFERSYPQAGMTGFNGGFDRSSYEERGFDGKGLEKNENRTFDRSNFDNKEFDDKFGSQD